MVSYTAMSLLYSSYDQTMVLHVGYAMSGVIATGIIMNLLKIIGVVLLDMKLKIKHLWVKHVLTRRLKADRKRA